MDTEDRGPTILGATWALLTISTTFMGLRFWCKLRTHRRLGWDDYFLLASWILLLIVSCLYTAAVSLGLGKHVFNVGSLDKIYDITALSITSAFLVLLSVAWSKTSFVLTLIRLTDRKMTWFLYFVIVSVNILLTLAAIFLYVQCDPVTKNWNRSIPGTCWSPRVNQFFAIAVSAYSGAMDFILAFIPWVLLWNMQMKKREKIGVVAGMSMGTFAGIAASVKCVHIPDLKALDFTFDGLHLAIWGFTEPAVTIMAASLPNLRTLFQELSTEHRESLQSHNSANTERRLTVASSFHQCLSVDEDPAEMAEGNNGLDVLHGLHSQETSQSDPPNRRRSRLSSIFVSEPTGPEWDRVQLNRV